MKRFLFTVVLVFSVTFNSFSQSVQLVEDLQHLATSINNGITMFQSYMQAVDNYKLQMQNYLDKMEQLKGLAQSMGEGWDGWNKFQRTLEVCDTVMQMTDVIENMYNQKSIYIYGCNFSLNDIYGNESKVLADYMEEHMKRYFPSNMTEKDVADFYNQYGFSAYHYYKLKNYGNIVSEGVKETIAQKKVFEDTVQSNLEQCNMVEKKLQKVMNEDATLTEEEEREMQLVLDNARAIRESIELEQTRRQTESLGIIAEQVSIMKQQEYEKQLMETLGIEEHNSKYWSFNVDDDECMGFSNYVRPTISLPATKEQTVSGGAYDNFNPE